MIKVKWKCLYHDSFNDPEDFYEYKEGEVISFVSGFLGIRCFAIIKATDGFHKVNIKHLIPFE